MSTIRLQLEYAITQPWFSLYVKNLKTSDFDSATSSIVDAFRWRTTDELEDFWETTEREVVENCGCIGNYSTKPLKKLIETEYSIEQHPEFYL